MGLFMFLPQLISELQNDMVDPDDLAIFGGVIILVGVGLWLFAWMATHRAYVQCRADVLLVRTPFYRVMVSYRRVKTSQSVKVAKVFPRESLKGMERALVEPLLAMTAAEVHLTSWPKSRKRLMRFMSRQMFSQQEEAWIFIVPEYGRLIRQIDAAVQRKAERESGTAAAYEDPFERLKYL